MSTYPLVACLGGLGILLGHIISLPVPLWFSWLLKADLVLEGMLYLLLFGVLCPGGMYLLPILQNFLHPTILWKSPYSLQACIFSSNQDLYPENHFPTNTSDLACL